MLSVMSLDTSLPSSLQEQIEQAIRDVISGVSHSELETIRELPDPASEEQLCVPEVPELQTISIHSFEGEFILGIDLYFSPIPEGDVPVVPDDIDASEGHDFSLEAKRSEPTYLGDLGGPYVALSDAIITILTAYCDALEENPEMAFLGEQADFLCTMHLGEDLTVFTTYLSYPEYVERIYSEGLASEARRLGLPF